jgi:hypothetical protein
MLGKELRGETYSKTDHRNQLLQHLQDRSAGSVERKHQNISAILLEAGFPFIDGYKPLRNYQHALAVVILRRVRAAHGLLATVEDLVDEVPASARQTKARVEEVFTSAPDPLVRDRSARRVSVAGGMSTFDFPERDARNRELGRRGEELILELERQRLSEAGHDDLARAIEWVAETRGPEAGYDIRSFTNSGTELLIEVKTTNFGPRFPFVISRNEVAFSEQNDYSYRLYRLFRFSRAPRCFVRSGAVSQWCLLGPRSFYARI